VFLRQQFWRATASGIVFVMVSGYVFNTLAWADLSAGEQHYNRLIALYNSKQYQAMLQDVQTDMAWSKLIDTKYQMTLHKLTAIAALNLQQYPQAVAFFTSAGQLSRQLNGARHTETVSLEAQRLIQSDLHNLLPEPQLIAGYEILQKAMLAYDSSNSALSAVEHNLMAHYDAVGTALMQKMTYDQSLQWFLKAYELHQKKLATEQTGSLAFKISQVYFYTGQKENAQAYYNRAKSLYASQAKPLNDKEQKEILELGQNIQALDANKDYAQNVENKNFRWKTGTRFITVYFKPGNPSDGWKPENIDIVKQAFSAWQNSGVIPFQYQYTDNPKKTDITVEWIAGPFESDTTKLGLCQHRTFSDKLINLNITLALHSPLDNKPLLSDGYLYAVALHEIGHSLGITGHSSNPQDVMYKASFVEQLSARDLETVKAIYQKEAPAYNVPGLYVSDLNTYANLIQQAEKLINQNQYAIAEQKLKESQMIYSEEGDHIQYLRGFLAYKSKHYAEAQACLSTLRNKQIKGLNELRGFVALNLWEKEHGGFLFFFKKSALRKKQFRNQALAYLNDALNEPDASTASRQNLLEAIRYVKSGGGITIQPVIPRAGWGW
jgi:hypothetical protein